MSNRCIFTVPASRDIESIIDYVADNTSLDAADKLLRKINKKCSTLANFPHMGRSRDELLSTLRSLPIDNYLIFYRPIEEGIEILRVVSGYRDLEVLFDETKE
ncbi:MAG: type II toxin-antitoxin system RelE/ParE family toxin [Potamolinea sp.]